MKLLFFDIYDNNVESLKTQLSEIAELMESCGYNLLFKKINVKDLPDSEFNPNIYVSPANSYGFMDGGIDDLYTEMFSNIQDKVMQKIGESMITCKLHSFSDMPALPIGSAVMVNIDGTKQNRRFLIAAPTMVTPGQIIGTRNVYYAFLAILNLLDKTDGTDITVAIPGMGTGIGKLTANESAEQIAEACLTFLSQDYEHSSDLVYYDKDAFILKNHACPFKINHFSKKNSSELFESSDSDEEKVLTISLSTK